MGSTGVNGRLVSALPVLRGPPTVPRRRPLPRIMVNPVHALALAVALTAAPAFATPVGGEDLAAIARGRLAGELLRAAELATSEQPLGTGAIEAARALAELAMELAPADADGWRLLSEVAIVADDPALGSLAIQGLLAADPADQSAQLARIRDAIDQIDTASERVDTYERLLDPSRRDRIGAAVTARLALDAALLQRRLGNIDQFARWLAEAVALDPTNADAAALAAGYFGDESADAFRRAELMTALVLANLRDTTSQVMLAELLSSYGAYAGSHRMYEMAISERYGDLQAVGNDLLADCVMMQWAAGDAPGALLSIRLRQQTVDGTFRTSVREQEPRVTALELARLHGPLAPKLATVRAAILADTGDELESAEAMESTLAAFEVLGRILEAQNRDTSLELATNKRQAAWVALWLGTDPEVPETLLSDAAALAPLAEGLQLRFDGWLAMRRGETDVARSILESLDEDEAIAALALMAASAGDMQAASSHWHGIAERQPGTLLGIWSIRKLAGALGRRVVVREEAAELNGLIAEISPSIDRYAADPRSILSLRVRPREATVGPLAPIIVDIELRNNGVVPLSIGESGTILPLLLLEPRVEIANTSVRTHTPIIIPVNRAMVLRPHQRLTLQADLRRHWIGGILNQLPRRGGVVRLRAVTNFTARQGNLIGGGQELVFEPGRFGVDVEADQVRIDGVRLTDTWLSGAIESVKEVTGGEDLTTLALLTWVVGEGAYVQVERPLIPPPPGEPEPVRVAPGERHPLQDDALAAILIVYPSLDPMAQAWLLSVMGDDPSLAALQAIAAERGESTARIAWLLRLLSPMVSEKIQDDSRLLAMLQDEDDRVRSIAKWVHGWIIDVIARRNAQRLNAPSGSGINP